jgi:formylmethanofuran dehydrogenase subunit E
VLDNYDLFLQHDAKKEDALERLPICAECGEHIQDDECYEIDNEIICPQCLKDNHRRWTDSLIYTR